MTSRLASERLKMVAHACSDLAQSVADTLYSCDELYRDGGQGAIATATAVATITNRGLGAGGHEQRTLGIFIVPHAGNRQWHLQLVRCAT